MTWSGYGSLIFCWWCFPTCEQHTAYKIIWHYLHPHKPQFKTEHSIVCPEKSKHGIAIQTHYSHSVDQEMLETVVVDLVTDKV